MAETTLNDMIDQKDYDCTEYFQGAKKAEDFTNQLAKRKESRLETEVFYLKVLQF